MDINRILTAMSLLLTNVHMVFIIIIFIIIIIIIIIITILLRKNLSPSIHLDDCQFVGRSVFMISDI